MHSVHSSVTSVLGRPGPSDPQVVSGLAAASPGPQLTPQSRAMIVRIRPPEGPPAPEDGVTLAMFYKHKFLIRVGWSAGSGEIRKCQSPFETERPRQGKMTGTRAEVC